MERKDPHRDWQDRWAGQGGPAAVMVVVGQCGYVIWWYKSSKPRVNGGITSCWMCHQTLEDKR